MSEISDFDKVAARLIEAHRPVYDQLMEDMRFHGACWFKSKPDGTVERVDPKSIHSEAPVSEDAA